MEIKRRFRRELQQELTERRRLSWLDIALLLLATIALSEWVPLGSLRGFVNLIAWGVLLVAVRYVVVLAFAQIRAHARPLDHTIILRDNGVWWRDNIRDREQHIPWERVQRVAITKDFFEFKLPEAEQGESYLLKRRNLSDQEVQFVAEKLLEA